MLRKQQNIKHLLVCIAAVILTGSVQASATDEGIAQEIRSMASLLSGQDRIYFEGKVFLNHLNPTAPAMAKETHTFSTWYFAKGKKYKTFYDDGKVEHNSVWNGNTCFSWHSGKGVPPKGKKMNRPEWDIGPDHMVSPSDFVLDGLNGYRGLLHMFEFSNRNDRGNVLVFDVRPSGNNPMHAEYPDNAIMRFVFDTKTGLIVATYQELPGKMTASFKVVNHWFNGDPAVVLRTPINVNFE